MLFSPTGVRCWRTRASSTEFARCRVGLFSRSFVLPAARTFTAGCAPFVISRLRRRVILPCSTSCYRCGPRTLLKFARPMQPIKSWSSAAVVLDEIHLRVRLQCRPRGARRGLPLAMAAAACALRLLLGSRLWYLSASVHDGISGLRCRPWGSAALDMSVQWCELCVVGACAQRSSAN